jgi:hypothetical protein
MKSPLSKIDPADSIYVSPKEKFDSRGELKKPGTLDPRLWSNIRSSGHLRSVRRASFLRKEYQPMASSNAPAKAPERQPEPATSTPRPTPKKPNFTIRVTGMVPV